MEKFHLTITQVHTQTKIIECIIDAYEIDKFSERLKAVVGSDGPCPMLAFHFPARKELHRPAEVLIYLSQELLKTCAIIVLEIDAQEGVESEDGQSTSNNI